MSCSDRAVVLITSFSSKVVFPGLKGSKRGLMRKTLFNGLKEPITFYIFSFTAVILWSLMFLTATNELFMRPFTILTTSLWCLMRKRILFYGLEFKKKSAMSRCCFSKWAHFTK